MDVAVREVQLASFLGDCPLFRGISSEVLEYLSANARTVSTKRGETIVTSGKEPAALHLVLYGQVKLSILSSRGSERVVNILSQGDSFGISSLFSGQPMTISAYALNRCEVVELRKDAILSAVYLWPELSAALLQHMGTCLDNLYADLESCCLKSATQRVAGYLLKIAGEDMCGDKPQEVVLPVSKSVVASSLDLPPETFSRELHRLSARKLIAVKHKNILISDVTGLQTLAE
ncbi:MAG: Crp/Fnr family transcriptional regulator [gamma proteobacterium endosymbiont of Lamellibrachia anaximandri]|nr:Crp/Fnr family transcriptional regulator [gamma proteobacterium endosymbiont of Lamellibrachia anaximandri]